MNKLIGWDILPQEKNVNLYNYDISMYKYVPQVYKNMKNNLYI